MENITEMIEMMKLECEIVELDQETLEAEEASDSANKCVKVKCNVNSFEKFSNEGAWDHLAATATLHSLIVEKDKANEDAKLSLKCLKSILPYFDNLVHLDFSGFDSLLDLYQPIAIDQKPQRVTVVEMKKLKHLTMKFSVFFMMFRLYGSSPFSTSSLKTLILLNSPVKHLIGLMEDELTIKTFVERQKDLEILILNLNHAWIFQKPLMSDVQLRKIDLNFKEKLETQEQNNMLDFLDSQKGLEWQKIQCKGEKTDRMLDYQMKLLNSAGTKSICFLEDEDDYPEQLQEIAWSIDSEGLYIELYSTEFLSYPHEENLSTVDLSVTIEITKVQALIINITKKFPNLKDLKIELKDKIDDDNNDYVAFASINLSNLSSLEKLESLELKYDTFDSSPHRLLENITIPNLQKFVYYRRGKKSDYFQKEQLINLKNFVTRHGNLNNLKFEVKYKPSNKQILEEAYLIPKLCDIFVENFGFNRMVCSDDLDDTLVIHVLKDN